MSLYRGYFVVNGVDPSGKKEEEWSFGAGLYPTGVGGSADIKYNYKTEDCCKDGKVETKHTVEISVNAHAGLGLGGSINVGDFSADLSWKGPGITASASGTGERCGGDGDLCVSVSVSGGASGGASVSVGGKWQGVTVLGGSMTAHMGGNLGGTVKYCKDAGASGGVYFKYEFGGVADYTVFGDKTTFFNEKKENKIWLWGGA